MIAMTPVERFDMWFQRHAVTLLLALAWVFLTMQVSNKADRSVVERLEYKMDAILKLSCKANPGDSVCPR